MGVSMSTTRSIPGAATEVKSAVRGNFITVEVTTPGIGGHSEVHVLNTIKRSLTCTTTGSDWKDYRDNYPVNGRSKVDGASLLDEKICKWIENLRERSPDKSLALIYRLILLRETCSVGAAVVHNGAVDIRTGMLTNMMPRGMLLEIQEKEVKHLERLLRRVIPAGSLVPA